LEFKNFASTVINADVTLLAGYIALKTAGYKWALRYFTSRVLYVYGNPEFNGEELERPYEDLQLFAKAKLVVES